MASVDVPDEEHVEPFVQVRLIVVVPAVSDVAYSELEQIARANSTARIRREWSLFITVSFHPRSSDAGA
jgi:hypothetical protein